MNKKVIKDNKEAFDHWLNGGEGILSYCFVFTGKQYKWSAMYEESDVFEEREVPYDIKSIVINDDYVEFRKALCEGKTIQFKDLTGAWNDFEDPKFKDEPRHYRIKPEEPQSKVGDFVRDKTDNITYKLIDLELESNEYFARASDGTELWLDEVDNLVKWEPQAGELIWVTDGISEKDSASLVYFEKMLKYNYQDTTGYVWVHCEPFLNSKPSWFKE